MTRSRSIEQMPPSWLGFHRGALISVLLLDCLWMFIEVATGASIVGIPALPFIAFILFGLSFFIVFSKQRILGDSYFNATWKSFFMGVIAGLPFPVFYTLIFMVFAGANKILPKTKGIGVKLPSLDHQNLGKFTSEFKELETLLKQAAEQIDIQQSNENVFENIKFLRNKGIISEELTKSLHNIRKFRNNITHTSSTAPTIKDLRLLKRCKEEVEIIFKR
jgi:hypothetical protein